MNEKSKAEINNSDILFIYDAALCNPNGDPDDENKPRMDYDTETNLVTDVRLKRYIRDYLENQGENIFVSKVEGKTVDVTQRLGYWFVNKIEKDDKAGNEDKKIADELKAILNKKTKLADQEQKKVADNIDKLIKNDNDILDPFLDVRLFGATMPVKGGLSFTFTGPVQFNWGYSLNKVNLVESSTISSTFAGRTRGGDAEEHGTFGKDYRVYYSLIAFHGIISGKRAKHTNLSASDIELFEKALIKSIPLQATRSKINQYPRLYIRIEYNDQETLMGDLRKYLAPKYEGVEESKVRDITQVKLDMSGLISVIEDNKEKIKSIHYWYDKTIASSLNAFLSLKDNGLRDKLVEVNLNNSISDEKS
jgi:CRISPR-associated protein Csh2